MYKIYIDPGHGGSEIGATRGDILEKDINLSVALKLVNRLKNYSCFDVRLSRNDDSYVDLNARPADANNWGADIFHSIHHNANDADRKGMEVYCSIYGGKGEEYALKVADQFKSIGQNPSTLSDNGVLTRKGLHGDYYAVIRNTSMPAIISEFAYIDSDDYFNIDTDEKQDKEAAAIENALCNYFAVPVYVPEQLSDNLLNWYCNTFNLDKAYWENYYKVVPYFPDMVQKIKNKCDGKI